MSSVPENEFDLEKLFLPAWAQNRLRQPLRPIYRRGRGRTAGMTGGMTAAAARGGPRPDRGPRPERRTVRPRDNQWAP